MRAADFSEEAYEAPLYNQLERGTHLVWTPGRVLEARLGFDRGVQLADAAVWQILGHGRAPRGVVLSHHELPWWRVPEPRRSLPDFRLNLFLQAKRSNLCSRIPRPLRGLIASRPCFSFRLGEQQHEKLVRLATHLGRRAHVAYAAPAFTQFSDLRTHTRMRSIVSNSTFPSASALAGHEAWYYWSPGATGVANPEPTVIDELPIEQRLGALALSDDAQFGLSSLDVLAEQIRRFEQEEPIESQLSSELATDSLELDRILEPYGLRPSLRAYAQVSLFAAMNSLNWLVVGSPA